VIGLGAEFTDVQLAYLAAHDIPCVLAEPGVEDVVSQALAVVLDGSAAVPVDLAG
jgi:hypothetical protein